jgi:pimeloyl-ACP methyl ester carboxylesterase
MGKGDNMPEVVKNDLKIYYESHGRGYPLILIRGLGSNADHWYAQVPAFERHYRVIVFDNRGIARSGDPGSPFSIQDMAEDTVSLMDALQIGQAHVLGLSMGGMIAQEIAIRYPERVKGLILTVTHCGGAHQVRAEESVVETIRRMIVENGMEVRIKAVKVFFAPRTLMERPEIVQEYAAVSMRYPADSNILQRQWDAINGHDACDRLEQVKAATLVLTGADDVVIPTANSKILAERISKAELLVVPGGGHHVLIEQPRTCHPAVIDFLKKVDD